MKYLVTGGSGFIGSNIVEALLKRGDGVRVLDNYSTGKRENLGEFGGDVEIIEGDIRSYHVVEKAVRGMDVILHQAALPSVPRSIHDPITTNEVNVTGTLNILSAAREAGVKRIVYASSSSVYGDSAESPKHEGLTLNPLSPYAVSKLTGEKYCQVFARIYGMETIALRYFNVFGPRQDPQSQYSAVIPRFIRAMGNNEKPVIFGDGTQSRDFTFVSNVVNANLLASTKRYEGGMSVNCACHGQTTLNELVVELNRILGKNIQPIYKEPRPGDVKHSFASIEKIGSILGFTPTMDFRTGLKATCEYYLKKSKKVQ